MANDDDLILDNVLWVPTHLVTPEIQDAYTYKFEQVEYQPDIESPQNCANCDMWGKKWRNGRKTCKQQGFELDDICKHFVHKKLPVIKEVVLKTYARKSEDWTTFARGDLGKIDRLFGEYNIIDQRVAPKLGFDLKCHYKLYDYQQAVVEEWLRKGYGIIQAPTSWGKTIAWAWLIAKLGVRVLLLAQEVRHLMVGFEGLYEATNIAELEEEAGEHLIGIINKDWVWGKDKDGDDVRKFRNRPGKSYPITFGTYQAFASKRGKKLRKKLKNDFGILWLEECLTGDTLVPTIDRGIVRLDEIAKGDSQSIELAVGTRYGSSVATRWISNGKRETLKITTKLGNSVCTTLDHKMLSLNPSTYELTWIKADNLQIGDYLCVPQHSAVRDNPLILDLRSDLGLGPSAKEVKKPTVMSPDLAFIIACVVAEGGVYNESRGNYLRTEITNSDEKLLDKFSNLFRSVFGLDSKRRLQYPKGTPVSIRGDEYLSSKDCFSQSVYSTIAGRQLLELGISQVKAPFKEVPWSILQSDQESQEAFLAGYLECDGFVAHDTGYLGFCSSSRTLLAQIQAILFSHGYSSSEIKKPSEERTSYYIRMSGEDSDILHKRLSQHLVTKELENKPRRGSKLLGIPSDGVLSLFRDRRVPSEKMQHVRKFFNDDDEVVKVGRINKNLILEYACPLKTITYKKNGLKAVAQASKVSSSMGERLQKLVKLNYRYVKITSIEEAGEQEVYDLTLADTENRSFIANGLISSNCHHQSAETFHAASRSFNPKYRGGQTATPTRKDKTHVAIYDTFGPVTARGTREAMTPIVHYHNSDILVPDRIFKGKWAGPRIATYLASNRYYGDLIFETVLAEIEEGRKVLVVTERRNHAFSLQQKLQIEGYGCELIIGGTPMKPQDWYARELMNENLHCIIGTKVINENVNIPPLDSIHLPFPNFTKETEEQRVGRIRRFLSGGNIKYMKEQGIEWEKPQPRVHVYTWHSSNSYSGAAFGFRDKLYKKWGFDFDSPASVLPKKKRSRNMKDWLKEFDDE